MLGEIESQPASFFYWDRPRRVKKIKSMRPVRDRRPAAKPCGLEQA
jgi:hypothetical protein